MTSPDFAISPLPVTTLAIAGIDQFFPVGRIFCIGRNYAAHAVEMGHDPDREPPFFFLKSASCIQTDGTFAYPTMTSDVHHEVEMVVALKSGGTDIPEAAAPSHVFGYGIGLDMTRRDLQGAAKKAGRPWEAGKAFEGSAPMGPLHGVADVGHPASGSISLKVNGETRQTGDLDHMIWKVPEMIAVLSRYFQLRAGDLIMTGTPAGVGPVEPGDVLDASIAGLGSISVRVV